MGRTTSPYRTWLTLRGSHAPHVLKEGGREKVKKWGTSSLLYTAQPRERFSRLVLERGFLSSQGKGQPTVGGQEPGWEAERLDAFLAIKMQSLFPCTTYAHIHVLPPKSPPCTVQFSPQHFLSGCVLFILVSPAPGFGNRTPKMFGALFVDRMGRCMISVDIVLAAPTFLSRQLSSLGEPHFPCLYGPDGTGAPSSTL